MVILLVEAWGHEGNRDQNVVGGPVWAQELYLLNEVSSGKIRFRSQPMEAICHEGKHMDFGVKRPSLDS